MRIDFGLEANNSRIQGGTQSIALITSNIYF
jgi:hypothetical protein